MSFSSCSHQPSANAFAPKTNRSQFDGSTLTDNPFITDENRTVLTRSNDAKEMKSPNGSTFITGIYRHYKGPLYQVIGACKHTETGEELVFYRALYGEFGFWARPYSMFFEDIEYEGQTVPRFTFIE